ncbi:MAG: carbamoyltransferase N-terminal domain-containing protein, partial [Candidatus Binatia bacterium]
AIQYCLESAGLGRNDIDYLAHSFSYEPFRSMYEESESDFTRRQFAEVYSRTAQLQCLDGHLPGVDWNRKLVQVPHHLAHAASAFYATDFEESLILVADGMGELDSTTIAVGQRTGIKIVKRIRALHSLGILYSVFTLYLGFHPNLDEYKLMGLAPYGDPRRYFNGVMGCIHLKGDGSYVIPLLFRNDTPEEKQTYAGTVRELVDRFGPPREPEEKITQRHMDIAAALQAALQASLLHILRHFKKETGQDNLCMAGGVALNCTANGVIKRSGMFRRMFVQPAAGDDGSALGAALYIQRAQEPDAPRKRMAAPLWGPGYENDAIGRSLSRRKECESIFFASSDDLVGNVAQRLGRGEIVGWFQGRMEFGPRALGNRSIL